MGGNVKERKKTDFQAASQTHAGVPRNHVSQTRQPPKTPLQGRLWMGRLERVIADKPQMPSRTSRREPDFEKRNDNFLPIIHAEVCSSSHLAHSELPFY